MAGASAAAAALRRDMHGLLRQVSHDYERLQYNTVVSGAMKMLNAIEDARLGDSAADAAVQAEAFGILLRALYPAAPHITHALWQELGLQAAHGEIIDAPWPLVDEAALVQDEIELVLQIGGKLRGAIRVPAARRPRRHRGRGAGQRPSSRALPKASRRRRSSWCRAGWSMSWSEAAVAARRARALAACRRSAWPAAALRCGSRPGWPFPASR